MGCILSSNKRKDMESLEEILEKVVKKKCEERGIEVDARGFVTIQREKIVRR